MKKLFPSFLFYLGIAAILHIVLGFIMMVIILRDLDNHLPAKEISVTVPEIVVTPKASLKYNYKETFKEIKQDDEYSEEDYEEESLATKCKDYCLREYDYKANERIKKILRDNDIESDEE